ncbi:MAG: hypothetical protein KC620_16920 [Myxococcales bacterium]|nr:hypothetical protein [Myxococcales bacterium]
MTVRPDRPRARLRLAGVIWPAFGLSAVLAAGATIGIGWAYYRLPVNMRPWDPLHAILGAGGQWGHALGMVGSGLMVANLLYLVRRRWARLARLGPVQAWLAFHVAAGTGGVALVLAHSGGDLGNPIAAVSTGAAIVVLVTGVLGRWIYGQIAHGDDGEATAEGELVGRLRAALHGVEPHLWTPAERAERALSAALPPPITGPRAAVLMLPLNLIVAVRLRFRAIAVRRALIADLGPTDARVVLAAAREAVSYRLRARRQQGFKALIGTWRGVHRIATFVLLLTLVAHVVTLYGVGGM